MVARRTVLPERLRTRKPVLFISVGAKNTLVDFKFSLSLSLSLFLSHNRETVSHFPRKFSIEFTVEFLYTDLLYMRVIGLRNFVQMFENVTEREHWWNIVFCVILCTHSRQFCVLEPVLNGILIDISRLYHNSG